jgi:hypothetical protein
MFLSESVIGKDVLPSSLAASCNVMQFFEDSHELLMTSVGSGLHFKNVPNFVNSDFYYISIKSYLQDTHVTLDFTNALGEIKKGL